MKNVKAVLAAACVIALLLLSTSIIFYSKVKGERIKRESVQSDFERASKELEGLKTTIETMGRAKVDLEAKIGEGETRIQELNGRIAEEIKKEDDLVAKANQKEYEVQELKKKIAEEAKNKEALEKSLAFITKEADEKALYIGKLEAAKEEEKKKLEELENKIKEVGKKDDSTSLGTVIIN